MITLQECIIECAGREDLVREFNRLTGCRLGQSLERTGIERMIDEATGYPGESDDDMRQFCEFVRDYIWLPVALSMAPR